PTDFERRITAGVTYSFEDAKSDESEIHPTAMEIVAGIAKGGHEGRIKSWRANSRERDFEPIQQPDGNWRTCCPAHDDHNPSFIASDGVDENGKPKVLIYCRSGCSQDKVIAALVELDLWNRAPGTIEVPEAMKAVKAGRAKKPIKGGSVA